MVEVTPQQTMLREARDALDEGMKVELLLGGSQWLRVSKVAVLVDEVGLIQAQTPGDAAMVLFPPTSLIATKVTGY